MIKQIEIKVFPDKVNDQVYINSLIKNQLKDEFDQVKSIILTRKSIDSRGKRPWYLLRYDIYLVETFIKPQIISLGFKDVRDKPHIIIVGAGPAGYFAALECLESGLKPIVLDRGKDVRDRRKDLKAIQQEGIVNPDSNYCFGEGGAGTYSDGKLYTRSHKRGKIDKVLHLLVEHGAETDILTDAHPHIGSNKLPVIIAAIRTTIQKYGGEVHFNKKVTDLLLENKKLMGVRCEGSSYMGEAVVLATGHSARDIYQLLYDKNISIEAKPFALGLRIEHSQAYIDQTQYHQAEREENLPASSYSVVTQVEGKGVFSFCMCPGGLVVPAATAPGEIVVNGMSLSRRDSPFANSGLVTSIELDELEKHGYSGIFAAMNFQSDIEKSMFEAGDGSQKAPAQRVEDFVNGVVSPDLNDTSYIPGLISSPLHKVLPLFVYKRLRKGLIDINKKMRGYLTNNANIIGVESRTSAPVRIPRHPDTLCHPEVEGLYPCGEGAGYAGGIISAAMDGQNVIKAVKKWIECKKEPVCEE
ncbi:MAG: FAD-dependent oxidoreductase [Saprospiraceae bacterium]|nr:FAD-dependent oxidoreductase [Saprospiraceae bacterium]